MLGILPICFEEDGLYLVSLDRTENVAFVEPNMHICAKNAKKLSFLIRGRHHNYLSAPREIQEKPSHTFPLDDYQIHFTV